jgi:hypothetical protein
MKLRKQGDSLLLSAALINCAHAEKALDPDPALYDAVF